MGRGRKPGNDALKALAGAQPCRMNPPAEAPKPARPSLPDFQGEWAEGYWLHLVDLLERTGVLTEASGTLLFVLCEALSLKWLAMAELYANGCVISTDLGGFKANPAAAVVKSCDDTIRGCCSSLGLDPSTVAKLPARTEGPKDELGIFLGGRNA